MAALDDADRLSLRAAARDFLSAALPPNGRPVEAEATVFDRTGWGRMATELGLTGVPFAEEDGGSGLGLEAELLVHEELGRVLSTAPYLSTVGTVGAALRALDTPEAVQLRRAIAAGELVAAALLDPVPATLHEGQWRLSGRQDFVIDASVADGLLVLAQAGAGAHDRALLWLPSGGAGVQVEPLPAVDLTRRFARVTLRDATGTVLAQGAAAIAAAGAAQVGLSLGLAAESIGVAARALELTVDYVKVRHQFGRAIGSFQAVKHLCAEMVVRLEGARSALALAVQAADESDPRLAAAHLAVARAHCGERCFWVTNEAIHLHGGIGFTWEHPAHLYYRRARSNQQLLDPYANQRQLVAELIAEHYAQEAAVL